MVYGTSDGYPADQFLASLDAQGFSVNVTDVGYIIYGASSVTGIFLPIKMYLELERWIGYILAKSVSVVNIAS